MDDPRIEVLSEREAGPSWVFGIRDNALRRTFEVSMSWADYDLWSPEGAHPPSEVACAATEVLLEALSAGEGALPRRLDVSLARRHRRDADAAVRARLR